MINYIHIPEEVEMILNNDNYEYDFQAIKKEFQETNTTLHTFTQLASLGVKDQFQDIAYNAGLVMYKAYIENSKQNGTKIPVVNVDTLDSIIKQDDKKFVLLLDKVKNHIEEKNKSLDNITSKYIKEATKGKSNFKEYDTASKMLGAVIYKAINKQYYNDIRDTQPKTISHFRPR